MMGRLRNISLRQFLNQEQIYFLFTVLEVLLMYVHMKCGFT